MLVVHTARTAQQMDDPKKLKELSLERANWRERRVASFGN